jgi:phosphoribosyl-ATP pyrophosphohydrolase
LDEYKTKKYWYRNMELIIKKQTDKLGEEYLNQEDVIADIRRNGEKLIVEVDDTMYIIPFDIIAHLRHN